MIHRIEDDTKFEYRWFSSKTEGSAAQFGLLLAALLNKLKGQLGGWYNISLLAQVNLDKQWYHTDVYQLKLLYLNINCQMYPKKIQIVLTCLLN